MTLSTTGGAILDKPPSLPQRIGMVSAALEKDPAAPLNHDEEYTERTCIIVVQVNRRNGPISMGIVVDDVVGLSSSQKRAAG